MDYTIKETELEQVFLLKNGALSVCDWSPRLRRAYRYFSPDDFYEALIDRMVTRETRWLDIGCGRDLFPSNARLARTLSGRARLLVGVDPSPNVLDNPFLHRRAQCALGAFDTPERFDLATLRMVAEHVAEPASLVDSLMRLVAPGGKVVIYTVNRWSPASLVSKVTPMWFHHLAKWVLWRTEERDTFPVVYAMNTRAALRGWFEPRGFVEEHFTLLDDCRSFARFPTLAKAELDAWRTLRTLGIPYPESCIIGVYSRT
jgi:SAM-dependent methyltransferase